MEFEWDGGDLVLAKDFRLLFFVGSERSGTTLFGQILNYHPNCLIANESKFLERVLRKERSPEESFKRMCDQAKHQFESGLENAHHYSTSVGRYQPRWKAMGHLSETDDFTKREILVVGDKKARGAVKVFERNRERFMTFLSDNPNVFLLQMVRDPAAAGLSYMKSHEIPTFREACGRIIHCSHVADQLSSIGSRFHRLYYEDLLESPHEQIRATCAWLGLPITEVWLDRMAALVDKENPAVPDERRIEASDILREHDARVLGRYLEPPYVTRGSTNDPGAGTSGS